MSLITSLKRHAINILGWHTKDKIIILESDDWGAIRTSSKESLSVLKKNGVRVDDCHYTYLDSLATEEDLDALFTTLKKFKGGDGKHPVVTANCLVANPDFPAIEASGFQEYHWELFTTSLERSFPHRNTFEMWKVGQTEGVFHPQSHGREHLNVSRWMKDLQDKKKITRLAFDLGIYGLSSHIVPTRRGSHLAAFDGALEELTYDRGQIVQEGLKIFAEIFGYQSKSFIAPNYVWGDDIELATAKNGVSYLQGCTVQSLPRTVCGSLQTVRHYQGKTNNKGQRYLIRNAYFEPASNPNKDWVNSCLKEISTAFFWRKPAIIGTHRVNYVGYLNESNRQNNLLAFEQLLTEIVKNWPAVHFMSSDELGKLMDEASQ